MLNANRIRVLSTLLALLLAIPLSLKGLTGFSSWMSPFLMLNSVFCLKSIVLLNLAGFLVLIVILFRKRWFCHYICPVGWGCDMASSLRRRKASKNKRLPDISKYLALASLTAALVGVPVFIVLDPLAIFNSFFTIFSVKTTLLGILSLSFLPVLLIINIIFPDIWCTKLCPLGGLQAVLADMKTKILNIAKKKKKEDSPTFKNGRRLFIASGLGLMAGLAVPEIFKPPVGSYLRPPASVPQYLYSTLCIRCGNCIKACPTDIITHHVNAGNLLSWMTPEVRFEKGYCLETCNLCSKVCPSGAITLFDVKAKNQIVMGLAEVHLEKCLLTKNTECDRCKVSCKYDAITIIHDSVLFQEKPAIDIKKCVGCGACVIVCPEETISIKAL